MNIEIAGLLIFIFLAPALGGFATAIQSQRTKRRRMEMLHQERMAALEKGVPLPELPSLDEALHPRAGWRRSPVPLLLGIVFSCLGFGGMVALMLLSGDNPLSGYWPLPLPLACVGIGLLIFHLLTRERGN